MNHITLIGNVGKDPEVRTTQNGTTIASFSLATTEHWKDGGGEKQEKTTWHNCIVWGKLSAVVMEYVFKGSKVCVQGRYESRKWTDKNGNERTAYEANISQLELLGDPKGGKKPSRDEEDDEEDEDPRPRRRVAPKPKPKEKYSSDMDLEDDIPF